MRRKSVRRKSVFKKIALTIAVMVIIVVGMVLGFSELSMSDSKNPLNKDNNGVLTEEELKNRVSVLLVGADQRPGEIKFNTDSIILATIDPQSAQVSLLSIPRDTRVSIPGHSDIKINGVAPLTDLENLVDVVSDLTGVPIAGYIQTNFSGFKQIIDTLGGITVDVEKDMYFETGDKEDGYINLKKGLQRLDGSQALQYARFRNDALADISRTARQQVVLKAIAEEMLQLSTLPKLPWLIPQLKEAVNTNLELGDLLKIAKTAVKFKDVEIVTQTLPGRFKDIDGISFWEVDSDEAKVVVSNLLRGITTDKVIGEAEIDLLEPIEPSEENPLPQVPGSPLDPNGQESSEYTENPQEEIAEEPTENEEPINEEPIEEEPNNEGTENETGEGGEEEPSIPEEPNSPETPGDNEPGVGSGEEPKDEPRDEPIEGAEGDAQNDSSGEG